MDINPLTICKVNNPKGGKPEEEYVQIFVLQDVILSNYALVDRTFDEEGGISNEFRHIFVFPKISVDAGDVIYLHTGKGRNDSFIGDGGSTVHTLFWGADHCVWNNRGGDRATIIRYVVEVSEVVPAAE
jgi:hypothetical protein